jgi:hypothetical protein
VPARPSTVGVDAGIVFRHPYPAVLLLTMVAGALDALAFERFGVFTSNQAGNLVVVWTLLPTEPASALLSVASILGCGLGIAAVIMLRHLMPWLCTGSGSRVLLVFAAVLIVVEAWVGVVITDRADLTGSLTPELGTRGWWAAATSIALAAFSLAVMAAVFISAGGVKVPILASTNSYVDAVRYGTAAGLRRTEVDWRRAAGLAAGFPLAWTTGSALSVLLPFDYVGVAFVAAGVIIVAAVFARRVKDEQAPPSRTVQ